jgi:hypothetical protein
MKQIGFGYNKKLSFYEPFFHANHPQHYLHFFFSLSLVECVLFFYIFHYMNEPHYENNFSLSINPPLHSVSTSKTQRTSIERSTLKLIEIKPLYLLFHCNFINFFHPFREQFLQFPAVLFSLRINITVSLFLRIASLLNTSNQLLNCFYTLSHPRLLTHDTLYKL